jgi:hypothetical protein
MLKRLFYFPVLFLLVFAGTLKSQNVDITWGRVNIAEKRAGYQFLGHASDGSLFIMKTDKKGRKYLEKYDNEEFRHLFTSKIDFQVTKNSNSKKDKLDFEDIFMLDKNIVVFASKYDKQEDYYNLYARLYNFDGEESGDWEKIESIYSTRKRKSGNFDITLSKDKSKFLIKHTLPDKKKEPKKYCFTSYDSKLEKVFRKTLVFNKLTKREHIGVYSEKILNDGTVTFFAYAEGEKLFCMFTTDAEEELDGKDLIRYEIRIKNKDMIEMASFDDKEGNIVLAGFYNDNTSKKSSGISGILYIKLNGEDLSEESVKATAFTDEYLENFMSKRKVKKGRGVSYTYDLKHLIFNDNGQATLIAENTYMVQHCSTDPKTKIQTCYYTYHNDQLMVIGLTQEGDVRYTQYLAKYASAGSPNFGGTSYSVLPYGDDIVIFYNDHYKNYRPGNKKIRGLSSYKRTVLVKAVITSSGDISKEVLVRHKDIKLYIMPRYTTRTNTNKGLIMLGFYKKVMKFGKFELSD